MTRHDNTAEQNPGFTLLDQGEIESVIAAFREGTRGDAQTVRAGPATCPEVTQRSSADRVHEQAPGSSSEVGDTMRVLVDGAELFCSSRGSGAVCLVLCGMGTAPYERQMPSALNDRLRLVFVDLRGSGRSSGEPKDLTFDLIANDLEAVRVASGVERLAVLGHSIFGALAIEYGRRYPAHVSHVVTIGTPPRGDMTRLATDSAAFFQKEASEERQRLLHENLARLAGDASPGQFLFAQTPMRFFDARFDAAPLYAGAVVKPEFYAHLMGALTPAWDVTVGTPGLQAPLFIALGRHDYTVPFSLWDDIAPALPCATVQMFERSGHQPFFEEPDLFTARLTDWMTSRL